MKFVRLCGREGSPPGTPQLTCTKWMPESVTLLYDLRALRDAGNDLYGEQSHWIEHFEGEIPPESAPSEPK